MIGDDTMSIDFLYLSEEDMIWAGVLDAEIKLRKSEARKLTRLEEKIEAQRLVKDLEKRRSEKRRSLFEAQDEVDDQKEKLFDEVEQTLRQKKATEETLFKIRWRII